MNKLQTYLQHNITSFSNKQFSRNMGSLTWLQLYFITTLLPFFLVFFFTDYILVYFIPSFWNYPFIAMWWIITLGYCAHLLVTNISLLIALVPIDYASRKQKDDSFPVKNKKTLNPYQKYFSSKSKEELQRIVSLADLVLKTGATIHQDTGVSKIALSDIAKAIGPDVTKEQVQEAFHALVQSGHIEDDGDNEYMYY